MNKQTKSSLIAVLTAFALVGCQTPGKVSSQTTDSSNKNSVNAASTKMEAVTSTETSKTMESTKPADEQGKDKEAADSKKGIYDDSRIKELYTLDGDYTDEVGNQWRYHYHLPQIDADTPDAVSLNAEIKNAFEPIISESQVNMEKKLSLEYPTLTWESSWSGSILTLKISLSTDTEWQGYKIYHFDFDPGMRLSNQEFLKRLSIEPEAFHRSLMRQATQAYDEIFTPIADDKGMMGSLSVLRGWTLGNSNTALENLLLFPQKDQIQVLLPMGTPAGSGWYYREINVPLTDSQETQAELKAEANGVQVTVDDKGVRLHLEGKAMPVTEGEMDNPENIMPSETLIEAEPMDKAEDKPADNAADKKDEGVSADQEMAAEKTVSGCFSLYKSVEIGVTEPGGSPKVFLETTHGTLEVIDLSNGAFYGHFSNSGPLLGFGKVSGLKSEKQDSEGEDWNIVSVLDEKGEAHDLTPYVEALDAAVPVELQGNYHLEKTDMESPTLSSMVQFPSEVVPYAMDDSERLEADENLPALEINEDRSWTLTTPVENSEKSEKSEVTKTSGTLTFLGYGEVGLLYGFSGETEGSAEGEPTFGILEVYPDWDPLVRVLQQEGEDGKDGQNPFYRLTRFYPERPVAD